MGVTVSGNRFITYFRVSTQKQGKAGLGMDAQRETVNAFLAGRGVQAIAEYVEVESGRKKDRIELQRALRHCRAANATLVIAKLDRLARNVAFISALMESKANFVALDLPEANPLILHIMAAFAEHEARSTSERTIAALSAARERGITRAGKPLKLGRPENLTGREKGPVASAIVRSEKADKWAADLTDAVQACRAEGLTSLRQIAVGLTARGYTTRNGAAWTPTAVSRMLARID